MMIIFDILFRLPATFFHEFAHFIVAILTLCKVKGFSIIPRIERSRLVLGKVSVAPKYKVSLVFVGFAPIINIVLAYLIYYYNIIFVNQIFTFLLQFYLILGSFPSKQDFKMAVEGVFSISFLVVLFGIVSILKFWSLI